MPMTIKEHELQQVERANATGLQPVVFVHGLWLLPSSWDRWAALFEETGFTALTPGWPDDPDTVAEANAHPEVMAHKTIGQVAGHFDEIIRALKTKPAIIGHSFGGLLAQILAGRGLSVATVAVDPAPFRGVLPLPISALKSAWPVLGNPANRNRAVPLTFDQFRFGFANAVSESEAHELYDKFAVPASGAPLFQAASANLNPLTGGSGRHRKSRAWSSAVDLRAERQHRALGDHERFVPPAAAKCGCYGGHRNSQPRPCANDRQRLERSG